jgi:hypothetical protein
VSYWSLHTTVLYLFIQDMLILLKHKNGKTLVPPQMTMFHVSPIFAFCSSIFIKPLLEGCSHNLKSMNFSSSSTAKRSHYYEDHEYLLLGWWCTPHGYTMKPLCLCSVSSLLSPLYACLLAAPKPVLINGRMLSYNQHHNCNDA